MSSLMEAFLSRLVAVLSFLGIRQASETSSRAANQGMDKVSGQWVVHITYDVEVGDAVEIRELPFVLGILADFSGMPEKPLPPLGERKFIAVDLDSEGDAIEEICPHLEFNVPNHFSEADRQLHVELRFKTLDDFGPANIAQQVAPLAKLLILRNTLTNLSLRRIDNQELENLLQEVMQSQELRQADSEVVRRAGAGDYSKERSPRTVRLRDFVEDIRACQMTMSGDIDTTIKDRIADLDALISRQLNEIMHAEPLQKLEATWRGLHYLLQQTESSSMLKIKLINMGKTELIEEFEKVAQFDQSPPFKKIYDEAFGTVDSEPFAALLGDYEFGSNPQDIFLLERMSKVAAFSHAPFIAAASPALFNVEGFTKLDGPCDLEKAFDEEAYQRWNAYRTSDDSRYVGLCVPHVLMRPPYDKTTAPIKEFDYEETAHGWDHAKYLWGNAAFAFAACLTNAIASYAWCAAICGVEGGGLVEGLSAHEFSTDKGELVTKGPTELDISEKRDYELRKLGFIVLTHIKGARNAVFLEAQSTQKPQRYDEDDSRRSTQLPYIFACTRFAHYLKLMMRDRAILFMSRGDCESYLNRWISGYVRTQLSRENIGGMFPLREARVEVREVPGTPGGYRVVAFLSPRHLLAEMSVPMRLVVELP